MFYYHYRAIDRNAAASSCTRQTLSMNQLSSYSDALVMDLVSIYVTSHSFIHSFIHSLEAVIGYF